METYTASDASVHLLQLMKRISSEHEPICVQGEVGRIVMISEEDYSAIQETLYLMSIPGMVESILEADEEKIEDCTKELLKSSECGRIMVSN